MLLNQLFSDVDVLELRQRDLASSPDGIGQIRVRNDQLRWFYDDLYLAYRDDGKHA